MAGMTKEQQELENLLDARKKINARIKELQNTDHVFGTVGLYKYPNCTKNSYWSKVHQIRISKISSELESENGKRITIIENSNMLRSLKYIKKVRADLDDLIAYMETIVPKSSGSEDK